ncbi:MAG TPA: copper resistance CopC family protein, partial [Candidatus Limnocylindrales bacterium]|nr:copper resistance CopC family protein [Candidatus Limnocylindrales bacterium]
MPMRSRIAALLAVLGLLLASPGSALGHAELDTATPGPGDEVAGSPAEIVATFTQDLDMSRTTMEVRDASGATVAEGPELGDGPRELRLALPALAPGEYEVRWTSFSAEDSELERGRYSFTVLPAPNPTPAPTVVTTAAPPSAPATASPAPPAATPVASAPPDVPADGVAALLPIGIAAIALLAVAAWLLRRR